MAQTSYRTKIAAALGKLEQSVANPDAKSNTGTFIGEAFLWDEVVREAKRRSDRAWDKLEEQGVISGTASLPPGEHVLGSSPSFSVTAKVSEPVRRFDPDHLAQALKKKYKVPEPITKELVEQAKQPSKSTVTLNILERV